MKAFYIKQQRGLSLLGLLLMGGIAGFFFLVAFRVFPTFIEYQSIQKAVERSAREGGETPAGIRASFERYKTTDYFDSVTGKDLNIAKDKNDRFVVSYFYEKRISLGGPVYLLIEYQGSSKPSRND